MNDTLPKDRLSTTDENGKRVYLYPADYHGKYRSRRAWVHLALIFLFLALPWVYVGGRQLIFLNVAAREFYFFGLHFRAHDAPLLLFFVLAFVFLIGLITAIWGRLWCGWACPQTVFTDLLFRKIERWIEGPPRARKELDESPVTAEKVLKKTAKWLAFLFVSLAFTHSFLAYFVGSRQLIQMLLASPLQNWASFLLILGTTAIVLFDFGWFREQFCVIACPYGRFQSVMLDPQSMVVAYDAKRGEPRRGTSELSQGDCVSCNRCVQVCPTGIDIRRGLQMECIACTACIDACDAVMEKIKKPAGLIRYTSQAELAGLPKKIFSPRVVAFALLLFLVLGGFAAAINQKEFLDLNIFRAGGEPYQVLIVDSRTLVTNHFRLEASNQTGGSEKITIFLGKNSGGAELIAPLNPIILPDGGTIRADFFVRIPANELPSGSKKLEIHLLTSKRARETEVTIVGPGI